MLLSTYSPRIKFGRVKQRNMMDSQKAHLKNMGILREGKKTEELLSNSHPSIKILSTYLLCLSSKQLR